MTDTIICDICKEEIEIFRPFELITHSMSERHEAALAKLEEASDNQPDRPTREKKGGLFV